MSIKKKVIMFNLLLGSAIAVVVLLIVTGVI